MPQPHGAAARSHRRSRAEGAPWRRLLYLCFFASGAAGLALEIVWSKYLSYLLGNSIYGVSTVVAAFLGGLGLGAVVGGKLSSRTAAPLRLYARLELIVGTLGLLSPLAYQAAGPLFASLYGAMGGSGAPFLLVRFAILFAALLIPTIAMGATLPLVVSAFVRHHGEFGSSVSRLYGINTAGAVAGVIAAGFVLIPAIGLWKTAAAAALIDFAVAAAILGSYPREMGARAKAAPGDAPGGAATAVPLPSPAHRLSRLIVPLFAVSGFAAILYEVAWTRILSVPFGGMVYSFSAILAVYLLGIALGAGIAARLLRALRSPAALFGLFQLLLAGSIVLGSRVFDSLPHIQTTLIAQSRGSAFRLFAGEAGVTALIVLLPTLLLGALFPLAAAIHKSGRSGRHGAGSAVGTIYASNTLGSIAGSLLTGFVLIPTIGSLRAILAAAAANAAIGCLALLLGEGTARRRSAAAAVATAAAVAVALFATPAWQAERMSLGFVRLLRSYEFGGEGLTHRMIEKVGTSTELERLLFYREGRVATVTVLETGGRRALLINGKTDATTGTGEDMAQQVMVGQMPLLLVPDAKDVCIVGYGSGVTTHAVLTHPVKSALTIELEGAVIEAAPFFSEAASRPLSDPRSRLVVEDAGTYLRSTKGTFDVIISEPSNPWIAGVGNLFTKEFYAEARRRLRQGGIFCQWIQTYSVSPATLSTVFRTVVTAFPHGQLFYVESSGDLIILASPDREVTLDQARMREVLSEPAIGEDFARIGIHSLEDVLGAYRGRLDRVAREAGPGPVNTDDNSWLEHQAPLDLIAPQEENPLLLRSAQVEADLGQSIR
ncbi:MAG: fused MFS/spermidine synthase [Candidatus Latescibacteria bacterium]|nr:fused MFS/spermidine synthase [Candidatus Latescibacterota bacterium]